MGNNISDIIEEYLKQVIQKSQAGMIEMQRSDLAELFQCVPSQINYVISTRFSPDHGYVVESKRGGGGYIRIRQVQLNEHEPLLHIVQSIGPSMTQREAEGLIERLKREAVVTDREAGMLRAAVNRDALRIGLPLRDELRARMLVQMLYALFVTPTSEDG